MANNVKIKLKPRLKEKPFEMAGTEGTKEYVVLCTTSRGRIGIRLLGSNLSQMSPVSEIYGARIRVEPIAGNPALNKIAASLRFETGWKQPGDNDQRRFSYVAHQPHVLEKYLTMGLNALGVGRGLKYKLNPAAPKDLVDFLKDVAEPPASAPASQGTEMQGAQA